MKSNPCVRTYRRRDEKAQENTLPQMPSNLFQTFSGGVKLLHINIENSKPK